MPCSGFSALHGVNPNFLKINVTDAISKSSVGFFITKAAKKNSKAVVVHYCIKTSI